MNKFFLSGNYSGRYIMVRLYLFLSKSKVERILTSTIDKRESTNDWQFSRS